MGILEVLAEEAKKEERKAVLLTTAEKLLKNGISFSLINQCTGISRAQLIKLEKNK